jgi:hypothetical protein
LTLKQVAAVSNNEQQLKQAVYVRLGTNSMQRFHHDKLHAIHTLLDVFMTASRALQCPLHSLVKLEAHVMDLL